MQGQYSFRLGETKRSRWLWVVLLPLAGLMLAMAVLTARQGQIVFALLMAAYALALLGMAQFGILRRTIATYTWDDNGLARAGRLDSWQVGWADLTEVAEVNHQGDQTVFRVVDSAGAEHQVAIYGLTPQAEALRGALRSRLKAPAARPQPTAHASVTVEPSRTDLTRAAILPWMAWLGGVSGAAMLTLGLHTPWALALLGESASRAQAGLVIQGGSLALLFPLLPLFSPGLGWRTVLDGDGVVLTRGRRERRLAWHAVERVLWRGTDSQSGGAGRIDLVGGGRRLVLRIGSEHLVAALELICDRCRNARLEDRRVTTSRSTQDDRIAAILALPVPRRKTLYVLTALLGALALPLGMMALLSHAEAVDAANAARYIRDAEATVSEVYGIGTATPGVRYTFRSGGREELGHKRTPGDTWRLHPKGSRLAIRYYVVRPYVNWPADEPAEVLEPLLPFGSAGGVARVAGGLLALFALSALALGRAPVPMRPLSGEAAG